MSRGVYKESLDVLEQTCELPDCLLRLSVDHNNTSIAARLMQDVVQVMTHCPRTLSSWYHDAIPLTSHLYGLLMMVQCHVSLNQTLQASSVVNRLEQLCYKYDTDRAGLEHIVQWTHPECDKPTVNNIADDCLECTYYVLGQVYLCTGQYLMATKAFCRSMYLNKYLKQSIASISVIKLCTSYMYLQHRLPAIYPPTQQSSVLINK